MRQQPSLVPQNVEYLTAREITRQHLAGIHLESGNRELLAGRQVEAMAEFRTALNLDPQNEFAQQRISDALGPVPVHTAAAPQLVASADSRHREADRWTPRFPLPWRFARTDLRHCDQLRADGDVRRHVPQPPRALRYRGCRFHDRYSVGLRGHQELLVALEDTVLYACADTPDNHRLFDRMGLRSFYIPAGNPAQELNELMNSLRTLFEFKFVSLNAAASTITLRGPRAALEAATQFLGQLNSPRPEVMLDVKVFQVSHSYMRNIGLHVPNNFNLFNIPVAALAALGGQNIQDLINQLVASGGINQAGNQTIPALLAQLQSQQNSVFSQPLATFGGGLTLRGSASIGWRRRLP